MEWNELVPQLVLHELDFVPVDEGVVVSLAFVFLVSLREVLERVPMRDSVVLLEDVNLSITKNI